MATLYIIDDDKTPITSMTIDIDTADRMDRLIGELLTCIELENIQDVLAYDLLTEITFSLTCQ